MPVFAGLTQQQLAERMHIRQSHRPAGERPEQAVCLHAGEGSGGDRVEAADGIGAGLISLNLAQ